ncbi:hypothetical protein FSARC_9197 [Fusarium sarcochroum]|uniref:NACHT domain-containing protein n=1 Tax=Fusarium sarcochroum TaxID=1208366 RepID=A0A8H4X6D2_9HYPO|nr:hypothetical protein FSARC_9197 [Fusarium sarcochroum]
MLLDELDAPLDDVVVVDRLAFADYNESNILPQDEATLTRLRAWIQPTEYAGDGSEFKKHASSYLKGTNQWLLDSPVFEQWHEGRHDGILWIRGVPGTGKSVLAARLVDHLSSEKCPVLYFFFRHTIQSYHRPEAALRDWITQILPFFPPLQLAIKNLTSEPISVDAVESLSTAELWHLLRLALKSIPKAYCVLDALDEMDQGALEHFLHLLDQLGNMHPDTVKLIITSRPIATVEKVVRNLRPLDIRLSRDSVNQDISTYLHHRLYRSTLPVRSREAIIKEVLKKADGLFLYAKLAMDTISELETETETQIMETLTRMPVDLSVMYSDLLREHMGRTGLSKGLHILVLQLVTHATRPLRLLEISDCIKITQPEFGQDTGAIKNLIRTCCGPLLEVLPDDTVRVVHHSLTEYLFGLNRSSIDEDIPVFEPGPTHNRLALLCLSYLQAGCLDTIEAKETKGSFQHALLKHQELSPFTNYAANNWHVHIEKATMRGFSQEEVNKSIFSLVKTPGLVDKLIVLGGQSDGKRTSHDPNMSLDTEALLFAIHFDLTSFVKSLLSLNVGEAATYSGSLDIEPPLHQAVVKGNNDIVRLLINHGAALDYHNSEGATPLHLALGCIIRRVRMRPDLAVVETLLEAGADPWQGLGKNKKVHDDTVGDRDPYPPIRRAFSTCEEGIIRLFLPYVKTEEAAKQVFDWVINGSKKLKVVRLILELGLMDVNARIKGQTPLFAACRQLDPKAIAVLMEAGADPNILHNENYYANSNDSPEEGANALHALTAPDHLNYDLYRDTSDGTTRECFRLVLAAGANVNQVDHEKNTPLHKARSPLVAQLLLDAGADANAMNLDGETPLHVASSFDTMEALLGKVDINVKNSSGETILLKTLSEKPALDKVLKLLDLGADTSVIDNKGNSSLHYLAEVGGIGKPDGRRVLERLVQGGADPNLRNAKGETALDNLSFQYGHLRFIEADLETFFEITGADVNAVDSQGCTFLFNAINYGNSSMADHDREAFLALMARVGARFDVTDQRGRTLLHAAVSYCLSNGKLLGLLAEYGVDPKQTDLEGNTIWHEGVSQFSTRVGSVSTEVFHDITALGSDPRRTNKIGRLPLHVLCAYDQWALQRNNSTKDQSGATLFEYMLRKNAGDINHRDNDGVAPLHLVSTISTDLTRRLLVAGADARLATNEGLNVFHLAARCRQSNIIGLLLDWFNTKTTAEELHTAVSAKDKRGRSPLYYACASGRYQSVELLMKAGAVADFETYDGSAINGCADFEEEQKNWNRYHSRGVEPDAGGVLIDDTTRLRLEYRGWNTYPMERLEEILDLIIDTTAPSWHVVDEAITSATNRQHDYTVECLLRAWGSLGVEATLESANEAQSCAERRANQLANLPKRRSFEGQIKLLIEERHFDAVPRCITEYSPKPEELHGVLAELTRTGHVWLLDMVLTPEIILNLDKECDPDDNGKQNITGQRKPSLLSFACESEEPNMTMIQFLLSQDTSLHALVRGGHHHWWQTNQALPYMLKQGMTVDLKDNQGVTPLSASLDGIDRPWWSSKAAEMLLRAGADPKSVDNSGKSCLARVVSDRDIFAMLLQHGAVIDHSVLAGAILNNDTDMVQLMLESGADPNARQVGHELPPQKLADGSRMDKGRYDPNSQDELYALDLVIGEISRHNECFEDKVRDATFMRLIELLLKHGADPNARYPRTTVAHRTLEKKGSDSKMTYAWRNRYLDVLLQHPRLDINLQDSAGISLFYSAYAMGDMKSTTTLLERGADVRGKDNSARNILHLGLSHFNNTWNHQIGSPQLQRDLLQKLVSTAPELLDQVDKSGRTPLHCAMSRQKDPRQEVEMLVSAGADVCIKDANGDTPLHQLFKGMWRLILDDDGVETFDGPTNELLDLFLSKGADINARNEAGETPVFNYFSQGTFEAELPKAEVEKQDSDGKGRGTWRVKQALKRKAVVEREPVLWKLLEQLGVDWTTVDAKGRSLLHFVAGEDRVRAEADFESRRLRRFRFLMSKGLDPLAEDTAHRTALDVAAANKADDIIALFKAE